MSIAASRSLDTEVSPTAQSSVATTDPIFEAIDAHALAYSRLDIAPPETEEELVEYFEREQDEMAALTDLSLRVVPATIAGTRALLAYTVRCFRLQSWHEGTVETVLENVLNTVERTSRPIIASSTDPVFLAIRAHERVADIVTKLGDEDISDEIMELVDDETEATNHFSLTIPTTTLGVCSMISYALHAKELYVDGKDAGKSAALAAMLSSLMRSPVFNPIPAGASGALSTSIAK